MSKIQSVIDDYFAQHPINIEQMIKDYKENYKLKILDDKTGKPFRLGVDNSKLYIKENKTLM